MKNGEGPTGTRTDQLPDHCQLSAFFSLCLWSVQGSWIQLHVLRLAGHLEEVGNECEGERRRTIE